MNSIQRLVLNTNIQVFTSQCRGMCMIKPPRDMIGPADPISNLRHIKYSIPKDETQLEEELRLHREELQTWNEVFWTKHNLSFIEEKKKFEETELSKKSKNDEVLNADEVSVFYKQFLDKNWEVHVKYLFQWYKKHVFVTYLHLKVNIHKMFKKKR